MTAFSRVIVVCASLAMLQACQHTPAEQAQAEADASGMDAVLAAMLSGESLLQRPELEAAISAAESHPLGSARHPVRASGPEGQSAYLARLRCPSGNAPPFFRAGSVGVSVFGNIADVYVLTCDGADGSETNVYMDMYHNGHVEDRPVPGFTIVPAEIDAAPA